MATSVCIPWRETPERLPAFERVRDWWISRGFDVVTADSEHEVFNVAAARNQAVRKANSDTIVVADADTIPDEQALNLALLNPQGVTYPFRNYRYLTPESVHLPLDDAVVEREYRNSLGGLLVTTQSCYWSLGGQDERFSRWGYEDNAFYLAAQTLATVNRLPGVVHAFGHPADRDLTATNPGKHRYALYKFASGHPQLMRELIPQGTSEQ